MGVDENQTWVAGAAATAKDTSSTILNREWELPKWYKMKRGWKEKEIARENRKRAINRQRKRILVDKTSKVELQSGGFGVKEDVRVLCSTEGW